MTDTNKTPDCTMHEALMSYLYDEATPDETRRFEQHLTSCAACTQELTAFKRVREQLQQWQFDELPIVRVVADPYPARRSAFGLLKELLTVTPIWVKALGVVAMAMLVLAVMGTSFSIGRNGVSFQADLLRRQSRVEPPAAPETQNTKYISAEQLEQARAEMTAVVSRLIAENEHQQKDDLVARLTSLESQLQTMRSADLARVVARIQEHQTKIQTLERDMDRREGSDLTDILFSELMSKPNPRAAAQNGSD